MAKTKRPRLGRGLSSLMAKPVSIQPPTQTADASTEPAADAPPPASQAVHADQTQGGERRGEHQSDRHMDWIPVDAIEPNPYQPRQAFDRQALEQLAGSIKQDGLMQPIVVRRITPTDDGDRYQLVAGERRWRAAGIAELDRLPALVRDLDDQQLAEWAVIENLQREDLNPIERAEAFSRLSDNFGLSAEQIGHRVGMDRSSVSNILRLLDLQEDARDLVALGRLSAGHGRALLGLADPPMQLQLAKRAVAGGWSVRMVEAAVRRANDHHPDSDAATPERRTNARQAHLDDLAKQISAQLGTKVRIKPARRNGAGTIAIDFYNLDQFDALLERLGVNVE